MRIGGKGVYIVGVEGGGGNIDGGTPFLSTLPWGFAMAKLLHKLLYKGQIPQSPGSQNFPTQCNTAFLPEL